MDVKLLYRFAHSFLLFLFQNQFNLRYIPV
jgi:hypothetical protein